MHTKEKLSTRLREIVDALPLHDGMCILEIGCGTGAAAREVARRLTSGHVLAIDRSEKAIRVAERSSLTEIASGRLRFRKVAIEEFALEKNEGPFDIAFAVRVGALDGRHPELERAALQRIARALTRTGRLFIDGGSPLREILLNDFRRSTNVV